MDPLPAAPARTPTSARAEEMDEDDAILSASRHRRGVGRRAGDDDASDVDGLRGVIDAERTHDTVVTINTRY